MKRQLALLLSEPFQMFSAGVRHAAWHDKAEGKKGEKEGKREGNAVILFLKYKRKNKNRKKKTQTKENKTRPPWLLILNVSPGSLWSSCHY